MKKIFSKYLLSQTSTEGPASSVVADDPFILGEADIKADKQGFPTQLSSNEAPILGVANSVALNGRFQQGGMTAIVLSSLWRERLKKSHKIPRQSSKVRLRGRCLRTNRPRSVSQLFRISRQECRRLALDGQIPGVTRSS